MKNLFLEEYDAFIRYYDISGEGETLVFLPGLSVASIANFLPVATNPKLQIHRSIMVDYLGSGFSDYSDKFSYNMEDHAETVAGILEHENITSAIVVGHSMGGTVAIMLAISRPDLVSKLIVGEGNLVPGGGAGTSKIASFSKAEFIENIYPQWCEDRVASAKKGDEMATLISGMWKTANAEGLYENSRSLVELDTGFKQKFFNLKIPKLFVYGENSIPKNPSDAKPDMPDPTELKENGILIDTVPNAGHFLMFENLDGFVEVITKFINKGKK